MREIINKNNDEDCIQIKKSDYGEMAVKICTMMDNCRCGEYPCCPYNKKLMHERMHEQCHEMMEEFEEE